MEYPSQILFHNLRPSARIENAANEKIEKLLNLYPEIIHCRVVLEAPHHHKRQGRLFQIRMNIKVPGDEINISRHIGKFGQHENLQVALRDAFLVARQELQQYSDRMRRQLKHHEERPTGRIVKIFPQQGFGFIETTDKREIYFDENSVVDANFDHLDVGQKVTLAIESGEEGPQASTLHAKRKPKRAEGGVAV